VREMEDRRPSGVGPRGQTPNHPLLRWLKTVVVSEGEKARKTRQVGTGKTFQKPSAGQSAAGALLRRRDPFSGIEIGGSWGALEISLADARVAGQAVPGVEAA
jgi:hypothetical protein